MKKFWNTLISAILITMAGYATAATPSAVVFSGESIYKQAIKVALLAEEDSTYKLILTVFEYDKDNGLSYRNTKIVDGLNCNIQEFTEVNCETVSDEGETISFYSKPAEQEGKFLVVIEANKAPFPLGYSMVWERR